VSHPRSIPVPQPWTKHQPLRSTLARPQDLNPDTPWPADERREKFLAHKAATEAALGILSLRMNNATVEGDEIPAVAEVGIGPVAPSESLPVNPAEDVVVGPADLEALDLPVQSRESTQIEHDVPDLVMGTIEVGVRS
jgi:hypothetical protein